MTVGAANLTQADVRNATFNDAIPKTNASSIRKYGPNATLAQDLEPEYITVSHNSKTAWVTLQENNAIGILDIEKGEFYSPRRARFQESFASRKWARCER
jgi:hypothetical protein